MSLVETFGREKVVRPQKDVIKNLDPKTRLLRPTGIKLPLPLPVGNLAAHQPLLEETVNLLLQLDPVRNQPSLRAALGAALAPFLPPIMLSMPTTGSVQCRRHKMLATTTVLSLRSG